jgi:Mg2+/Co2+ transporter CorB
MTVFRPLVALINLVTQVLLKPIDINADRAVHDPLDREELRTVVNEAGALIPQRHRDMLFRVLDLEKVTVEDIMVPRGEVVAIDLDEDWSDVRKQLMICRHTRVSCCRGSLDNTLSILHLCNLTRSLRRGDDLSASDLEAMPAEPFCVPLKAGLHTQVMNFQLARQRLGLVADECGDISGLVTLDDVLEQAVGEFTTVPQFTSRAIHPQPDGSLLIDGTASLRELHRTFGRPPPAHDPRILHGLILEQLGDIPAPGTGFRRGKYAIDIV